MKKINIKLVLFFSFFCNSFLFSFDGNREGVILGLDIGYSGFINYVYFSDNQNVENYWDNEIGPYYNIKIGYSTNENLEFYMQRNSSIHKVFDIFSLLAYSLNNPNETIFISSGFTGLGCKYHFKEFPNNSSLFLSGALGISESVVIANYPDISWYGVGLNAGFGYEFIKHYNFSIDLHILNPSVSSNTKSTGSIFSGLSLTLGGLAY